MNKKAFTLIELLAVLVILGIIAMITVPIIGSTISSSKKAAYQKQIDFIENAARNYMASNSKQLPDKDYMCAISVSTLKEAGLLKDSDIVNPNYKSGSTLEEEKNEILNGDVIITTKNNKFIYTYQNNTSGVTYCSIGSEREG